MKSTLFTAYFLFITIVAIAQVATPRDTSYTVYSSYRKEVKKRPTIQIVKADMSGLTVENDITYKKIDSERRLTLDIYRPDTAEKYPAVIMIHGGGWNSGNKSMQSALAVAIAQEGFVCIPVEYRLSPEALFPAAIEDLEDAVRWILKNASKYGIDKNKIAVSGCSAGGQLACLLGTKNKIGKIKAVVNIDGISTFIEENTVARAQAARENNNKMPVDAIWLGGTYNEKPENWENASALYHVSKKSVPVCFINSSIPRFHNGRDELIEKLNSFGIYSEIHEIEDTPHTFWLFYPWFETTVETASVFLKTIFY